MSVLIVHADDYGISHEVNLAVKKGIKEGIIDRATLMVNMPYVDEAIKLAREENYLNRIGLHLNLVEGVPISDNIKNTWLCSDGRFNGEISNKKYKRGRIKDKKLLKCIEEEIDAQMKLFIQLGMPLLHVDSHQHSHIKPSVFPILLKKAKENGFNSIRLASLIPSDNPSISVKIYKSIINLRIKRYNKKNFSKNLVFPIVNLGCAFLSLKKEMENDSVFLVDKNIEMWFHPSLIDGKIVNLYCDVPFDANDIIGMKRSIEGIIK